MHKYAFVRVFYFSHIAAEVDLRIDVEICSDGPKQGMEGFLEYTWRTIQVRAINIDDTTISMTKKGRKIKNPKPKALCISLIINAGSSTCKGVFISSFSGVILAIE